MTPMQMIVIACAVASFATIVALWAAVRAYLLQQTLNNQVEQFKHNLSTATAGAIGMGQRIITLEKKLQTLHDAQVAVPDADGALYTQAMQLFDCGADVNTVMASCGISNSEASLMALIRQKTLAPSAAVQAAEA